MKKEIFICEYPCQPMLKRSFITNETNKKNAFSKQLQNKERMQKITNSTPLIVFDNCFYFVMSFQTRTGNASQYLDLLQVDLHKAMRAQRSERYL